MQSGNSIGYASIDRPWLKYYKDINSTREFDVTLYELIKNNNCNYAKEIALQYYGNKISYGQLIDSIEQCRKALDRIGVCEGMVISIISITTPELLYLIYAANSLGAVINMIDPRYTEEKIVDCITRVNSETVIVLDAIYENVSQTVDRCECVQTVIMLQVSNSMSLLVKGIYNLTAGAKKSDSKITKKIINYKDIFNISERIINHHKDDKDMKETSFIFYTGGSTGNSKAVLLSDKQINAGVVQYASAMKSFNRQETWLSISALFFAYAWQTSVHMPLAMGMTCCIEMFDPEKLAKTIVKKRINHLSLNPGLWEAIIKNEKVKDMSFVIAPASGGESLSHDLENRINNYFADRNCDWKICQGFGMTETAGGISINYNSDIYKAGSVGIPFVDMVISAFEVESENELKIGETGEICISGPSVMIGYYNNNEENSKALRVHKDGNLWLHTGDMGYVDEDGFVHIVGRIKRMIVGSGGWKIYPQQIEDVMRDHDDVDNCVAVEVRGELESDKQVGVFIIKNSSILDALLETMLRKHSEENLVSYMRPVKYKFVKSFPMTNVGKIDYITLEKMMND